jgi:hypothetical protein
LNPRHTDYDRDYGAIVAAGQHEVWCVGAIATRSLHRGADGRQRMQSRWCNHVRRRDVVLVSFPIRNGLPGSLCRIHPSWMLIRSPITIGSLSPRITDPNQIFDEADDHISYDRCTRRNPARRVDVRKKLIKLVGGHDARPCYRGAPLAPSPSVVRTSVSTKSGRRSADQS